jgi:sugar phosphate isomerase/epimerase
LNAAGIKLAIENGGIPAEDLKRLLDSVSSPWVGVTLDTVNSLAVCEGWRHVVRVLAPYTMCLHVKDFVVERVRHMMGFKVEGRPAGRGQLDIPWLLETLRVNGVSPNAILELWPPEQKTLQETIALEQAWAVESILYLRRFISD